MQYVLVWGMLWDVLYAFSMHMLLCVSYELIAIRYPLSCVIIRYIQSSSTPIVLLRPPLHIICIYGCCTNILCISYVHFVHQPLSDSLNIPIRPKHTVNTVEYVFIYLKLIVVCYLCCYTSISPCRVVTIPLQFFDK